MLNIHIWTHCDTFHYKQTMCVSRVNGKSDWGNVSKTTSVCNNRKNWFFKCHSFWQFGMNWILLNVNINMAHENCAKCEFWVYGSTDATADAASWSTFAAIILILWDRKPKIWIHINHCLGSAKAIPIQEVQNLLCVAAVASDAENLWMWCLASLLDIFWEILHQNLWNNSASPKQLTKQRFNNKQTVEKEFFIHIIEICCNSGMLVKSYRYWLLNWQP